MNKEEILKMGAGPELDKLVAEVLGDAFEHTQGRLYRHFLPGTQGGWLEPAPVSTDISAAWPIAVKMGLGLFPLNNKDWACCKASHIYHVEIGQDHYADPNLVICREAPEAISKAALITNLEEIERNGNG